MEDRIGIEIENKQGLKMTILNYRKAIDMDVIFEDGTIVKHVRYGNFKSGTITNPNFKSYCGIGFMGQGEYESRVNKIKTDYYEAWGSMVKRCYSETDKRVSKCYEQCKVDKKWHNFQNFADWYVKNKWSDKLKLQVDKDILVRGNKLYGEDYCILVDTKINCLFTKSNKTRGDLPIGVNFCKTNKKFRAQCSITEKGVRKVKSLGYFRTSHEAFYVYKEFKESYIKQVADEYFEKYSRFPYKLLKAMYEYEVEIDD